MTEKQTINGNDNGEKDTTAEIVSVCPNCGYNLTANKIIVSNEDCQDYFKCLLQQKPFSKTYTFYEGRLAVTLEEPTHQLVDKLAKASTEAATIQQVGWLVVCQSISSITLIDGVKDTVIYSKDVAARLELMDITRSSEALKEFNSIQLAALTKSVKLFETLCLGLVEVAHSENF